MHIALIGIIAAVLLGSYYLPDGARGELRADLGYAWAAVATLLGPLVRKRIAAAAKEEGEL
jgi:hypothetical protein